MYATCLLHTSVPLSAFDCFKHPSTGSHCAMDPSSTCYSIVHDDLLESPNAAELRNALQKGSDEVKLETMRRIIVGTLNGQSYVSLKRCR